MSSVDEIYTDSRLWLQKGWVDYFAPQLYWTIDGPQSFTKLIDWWSNPAQNPTHKHIYAGLADYSVIEDNWNPTEIHSQIQILQTRTNRDVWGGIHFSSKEIETNAHAKVYNATALTDAFPYLSGVSTPASPNLAAQGSTLDWSGSPKDNVRSWAVYKSVSNSCNLVKVLPASTTSYTVTEPGDYVVTAVNRLGAEADSDPVNALTTVVG